MERLKIGITHGDTNGVAYEMILKAMEDPTMMELCMPLVYGSPKIATYHRKTLDLTTNFITIHTAEEALEGRMNIVECIQNEVKIELGQYTQDSARAALASLQAATDDLAAGKIDAMVAMPVGESAIQSINPDFKNQKAFIQQKAGEGKEALTLLMDEGLRIALMTEDIPQNQLAAQISEEGVLECLRRLNDLLKRDFLLTRPRIAVLALNPTSGQEEENILKPALIKAEEERICVYGPLAAEELFESEAYRHYDCILAMSSNQVQTPFRNISHKEGIRYLAGLNAICTMPDEGVQMDKAGKGEMEVTALCKALFTAIDIHRNRIVYDEGRQDPLPKLFHDKREDKKPARFNVE